jgi:hypothetical protein
MQLRQFINCEPSIFSRLHFHPAIDPNHFFSIMKIYALLFYAAIKVSSTFTYHNKAQEHFFILNEQKKFFTDFSSCCSQKSIFTRSLFLNSAKTKMLFLSLLRCTFVHVFQLSIPCTSLADCLFFLFFLSHVGLAATICTRC